MRPQGVGRMTKAGRGLLAGVLGALGLALSSIASAEDPKSASPGLDRLLRLPASADYSSELKAGAGRSEWRQRFADARDAVDTAERTLEQSQKKLATVAGAKSEWQLSPPGVPAQASEDSSSSFTLREEVRRNRNERDRARARLRELEVEANLAGVPEDWRGPSTNAPSNDAAEHESETGASPRP